MNTLISKALGYLVDFAQYVQKFWGSAALPRLNYSWLIVLFFIFAIFLIGLNLGRLRILLSLICIYIAAFLESRFIFFDKLRELLKNPPEFQLHIGLFLVIYTIIVLIFNRSALKHSLTLRETSFFPIALIAILEIGFLASLITAYLPPGTIGSLPAGLVNFFGTRNAQFWWALAPLVLLLFMKRDKKIIANP